MALLPAIEMQTQAQPDAAVIWLHGLGADGNDFAPIVPELSLPEDLRIRFIFPHAPKIPVTVNGGYVMPAWYDIAEMQIDKQVDVAGLMASVAAISALIDRELERGIAGQRILLAGFSQGGDVAYQAAPTYPETLGGLLVMSSYFATGGSIVPDPANEKLSIEIHHGLQDPVVPEQLGRQALKRLEAIGYHPDYKTYPMEHGVCPEQLHDISQWIQKRLRK
ncbi:MAG: carboxylesterase [Desulfocapsaceae bacterium]|jgi:phospholipase/carboxylesterase|nr:carboxylesterase [Desulfocapsaceae bacterium]